MYCSESDEGLTLKTSACTKAYGRKTNHIDKDPYFLTCSALNRVLFLLRMRKLSAKNVTRTKLVKQILNTFYLLRLRFGFNCCHATSPAVFCETGTDKNNMTTTKLNNFQKKTKKNIQKTRLLTHQSPVVQRLISTNIILG